MFTYEYPRPALTADIVLFDLDRANVLLIRRGNEPYKDRWAFPGGFFDMTDRDIEHTAARELQEETGLADIPLTMACVASREGRDPRGRTVSVIFTASSGMNFGSVVMTVLPPADCGSSSVALSLS